MLFAPDLVRIAEALGFRDVESCRSTPRIPMTARPGRQGPTLREQRDRSCIT